MKKQIQPLEQCHFAGFSVNPGTIPQYLDYLSACIASSRPVSVFYHNLHTLHEYYRRADLRHYYADKTVLVDGMPLIPLLRLGGFDLQREQRITYVDFIWPILERAEAEGWRVFVVGQTDALLEDAFSKIRQRCPKLEIGGRNGFFDTTTNSGSTRAVIDEMNDFKADLCLIGMGTPRQEKWLHEHRALINAGAVMLSGACMEYVAGAVRTPPRWMGQWGLEWSFRFFENPRRFAHRYFVEPWALLYYIVKNVVHPQSVKVSVGD